MLRFIVLCLLSLASSAAAEDGLRARGLMQATAFRPLPAGAPIAVRPPDGSQSSADVAATFGEALARIGRRVDPGAAHQLTFRITDAPGVGVERPPNVELRGSLGAEGHDDAELVLRMQMLDRAPTARRTRTRLMVVEVADRGDPVWEARVEASAATDDDVALAQALIPHVLAQLGQDAYNLPVPKPSR